MSKSLKEEEIYRVLTGYSRKDTGSNTRGITFLRNAMFEPLWNNKYISNIQVTS